MMTILSSCQAGTLRRFCVVLGMVTKRPLFGLLLLLPAWLVVAPAPAQAAITCNAQADPILVVYQSGAAPLSNVMGGATSASCQGGVSVATYQMCYGVGASTVTGTGGTTASPYRKARSPDGNTVDYIIRQNNSSGPYSIGDNSLYSGLSIDAQGIGVAYVGWYVISVPTQNVPSGEYVSTVVFPMYVASNCGGTPIATFQIPVTITIRVGGTCFLQDMAQEGATFGQLVVDGSGNIAPLTGGNAFYAVRGGCSAGTPYVFNISDGLHPDGSGTWRRRMRNGDSYIRYTPVANRFAGGGSSGLFPTTGLSLVGDGGGNLADPSWRFNMRLTLLGGQSAAGLKPGVYSDTLILTITW